MLRFQHLGFFSENELFAMKKNVGQETKLREKIGSLTLQLNLTNNALQHNIKTVRQDLKEIHRSTGCSPEGIPTIRPTSDTSYVSDSLPATIVPQGILDQITNSDYGKHFRYSGGLLTSRKQGTQKIRAITGNIHSRNELEALVKEAKRRKFKSEGGFSKQLLSVNHSPVKSRNTVRGRTPSTPSVLQDDVFKNPENESISSSFVHVPETKFASNVADENSSDTRPQSIQSKEEIASKPLNSEQVLVLYNPWKIHKRSGETVDPLEIPKIRECYRPMCRLTCSTCLARKKKAPCFLVPGINVSHDHFTDEQSSGEENDETKTEKSKKNKKKAKNKHSDNEDFDITYENTPEHSNIDDERTEVKKFINECLEIKKNMGKMTISSARLNELSRPKDGFRKELRFSKTFIKKELEKMKKFDLITYLTASEKRTSHRIQRQIAIFLAVLNEKRQSRIKPINEVLDFPILEDRNANFSHLHDTMKLPTFERPLNKRRRKVWFQ